MNIRLGPSPQPCWAHLPFQLTRSWRGAVLGLQPGASPSPNPSCGTTKQGHPKIPQIPLQISHHLGFSSFQSRRTQGLSAPSLGVRVIFFLDKRSSEESRTYLFLLKLRTKGSKKMLWQLCLATLFCYEKVVLSLPLLHPNPCLDIRVISP